MSKDETVPSPNRIADDDYQAIEAAVMETARGRWFLAEYARRNRSADTASILEALNKLEQIAEPLDGAPAPAGNVDDVLAILAELKTSPWQGAAYREPRPAHVRPQQTAEGAITAVRRTAEKILEVAYELREAGANDMFSQALELYCRDLSGAADLQDDAVHRLAELAALLVTIEAKLRGNGGGPSPGEPQVPPSAESEPEPAMGQEPAASAEPVQSAPPTQPEPGDNDDQPAAPDLAPRAVAAPRLAFVNPG